LPLYEKYLSAAVRGGTVFASPHNNSGCMCLRQPFNNRLKLYKRRLRQRKNEKNCLLTRTEKNWATVLGDALETPSLEVLRAI